MKMERYQRSILGGSTHGGELYRHSNFKNKTNAKKFADKLRRYNKKHEVDSVGVRVKKLKKGWIVDEFDM